MTATSTATFDPAELEAFVGRYAADFGTLLHAVTVLLGDRLGLYRAMAGAEAMTSDEVAEAAGLDERYVREWLAAQYVAGYVEYDATRETFHLRRTRVRRSWASTTMTRRSRSRAKPRRRRG